MTCKTCGNSRVITIAAGTCQPEHQAPCPTCVGTRLAAAEAASGAGERCWECSCGWKGCYTAEQIAEHGEPAECNRCCRERLEEVDAPSSAASGAGEREKCGASPDHADILETIANAADDWQKQGYVTALAEVRDMANVGRALMEALPDGYHYMNCPSEIVTDLQNERDEALASLPPATDPAMVDGQRLHRALQSLLVIAGTPITDRQAAVFNEAQAALAAAPTIPATGEGGQ